MLSKLKKIFKILARVLAGMGIITLIAWVITKKQLSMSISTEEATYATGGVFLFILILLVIYLLARKGKKKTEFAGANVSETKQDGEKKLTRGQQVKRWWLIIIFGIPITYFLMLGMWGLVYKSVTKVYFAPQTISATFQWWKDASVYGTNPAKRSSIPTVAKIMKFSDTELIFKVEYYDRGLQKSVFRGEKNKDGNYEGTWSQGYPEDGGEWLLRPDPENKSLFVGKYSDITGSRVNFKIKINPR